MKLIDRKIKMGKELKPSDRFKLTGFGMQDGGAFRKVFVGFNRAYKSGKENKIWGSIDPSADKKGYLLLEKKELPVTKMYGKVIIRKKPWIVFEKARTIKKSELPHRLDEILELIKKAGKNHVRFDAKIQNFGINKDGKLVIVDTNHVEEHKLTAPEDISMNMAARLRDSIYSEHGSHFFQKVKYKIKKFIVENDRFIQMK